MNDTRPAYGPVHTMMTTVLLGPIIGLVVCYFYAKRYDRDGLPARYHWQAWAVTSAVMVFVVYPLVFRHHS